MMDTKHVTYGLVAILGVGVLAALGFYFYTPPVEEDAQELQEEHAPLTTYSSTELGFELAYPSNYVLETHAQDVGGNTWTTLVLIDSEILREARENGASEGPPAIAIQIFDNEENSTLEEWIENTQYSNYHLSSGGMLMPTTVGSEEGLAYRYSGLFETEAVVVAHGAKIYMFSVDWLTPEDANIHDFNHILASVTFI